MYCANIKGWETSDINIRYDGIATSPILPKTYEITVDVSEGTNYTSAKDLSVGTFTVSKAPQNAPAAPTLADKTATSVRLNPITGAEYRNGNGAWQDETLFEGLTSNVACEFSARMKETDTHEASLPGAVLEVTTEAESTCGITLNPSGDYTFATSGYGYSAPVAHSVVIKNSGNQPAGVLTIGLHRSDSSSFALSATTVAGFGVSDSAVFTVVPKPGLSIGTYSTTVVVDGGNDISASFNISFTVIKATQSVPAAPVLESKTATSVALRAIDGVEYRIGAGVWQSGSVFDNLTPNTSYTFYARMKGSDTHEPSGISEGLAVVTDDNSIYNIVLTPAGNHTFASAGYGYPGQSGHLVAVSNKGNRATGELNIALSGENSSRFTLSTTHFKNIDPDDYSNFSVVPVTGLPVGTYNAKVAVSGANNQYASFDIRFTVTKASQSAPPAPTLASKTATCITLNVIAGAEYSNGAGEWQDSPSFNGLTPETYYTFHARMKGSDTHEPGAESNGLTVATSEKPDYGIALNPPGNYTFKPATYGYDYQPAYEVAVSNVGNDPAGTLTLSLNGAGSSSFVLPATTVELNSPDAVESIAVAPVTGLLPGVYLATVTVSGENIVPASFAVNFTVNKVAQAAPSAPALLNKTSTGVTLETIYGAEYRNGDGEWQDSPSFNGLTPETEYFFYARMKGSDTHEASSSSDSLYVVTDPAPGYGISLNPPGNYVFATDSCGYAAPPACSVMVNNTGNNPTGALTVALRGVDGNSFILSATSIGSIAVRESNIFTVVPKTGLVAGTYTATVIISGKNNISASFGISFSVTGIVQSPPPAPTLVDVTATSVTLGTIAGAEYRNGNGEWQDNPSFAGLTPETTYVFYARMKGSDTHEASAVSEGLVVVTGMKPNYGIALNPSGNHTFASAMDGYSKLPAYTVSVINVGNRPAGMLSVSLSGEGSDSFILSTGYIEILAVDQVADFAVVPKAGLEPGVYSATVTIGGEDVPASFEVGFTVTKAPQSIPSAPVLLNITSTSVTLRTIYGAEYRNGDGEWQDSPAFTGLTPETTYVFYARMKGDDRYEASPSSRGLSVTTGPVPNYGISLNLPGNYTFATEICGYSDAGLPAYSVIVSNAGNKPTGELIISLNGENSKFTLSVNGFNNIDSADSRVFTVVPKTGLVAGTYTARVTVMGENGIFAGFDVKFTVNKAPQAAPVAVLKSRTSESIILETVENAEYRIGNNDWQSSPVFDSLAPYTVYTFYARIRETATHNESPSSDALPATTCNTKAELLGLFVNGILFENAGDVMDYTVRCDELSATFDAKISPEATVKFTVDGAPYDSLVDVSLYGDKIIKIFIAPEYGDNNRTYTLMIQGALNANDVLYQRWDNVLAVNSNHETNGGYKSDSITGVRWHRNNREGVISREWFIKFSGPVDDYYAEINIAGKWHNACGSPKQDAALEKTLAYPNPVSAGDNLTLHLPSHLVGGYMNVITMSGSTVKRKMPLPLVNNVISVSGWSPGVYLLNIVSVSGQSEAIKIIIN
jgi:hypothetical protein